jgi:hypothetical protein
MRARIKTKVCIANEVAIIQRRDNVKKSVFNELIMPVAQKYLEMNKEFKTAVKMAKAEVLIFKAK